MADAQQQNVISFDIIDRNILDSGENIIDTLTEDERNEVQQVVTLLEAADRDSLEDFKNKTNLLRHNPINDAELNRLAGKNNAQSTSYQTKWAICVFKGRK